MSTKLTKIIANYQDQLAGKMAVGAVTGTLKNGLDKDGVALPDGNYCMTFEQGLTNEEHLIFTLAGGVNMTAIQSVSRQGVITAGCTKEHRVGSSVKLTDYSIILRLYQLLAGITPLDASSPLSYDAEPSLTDRKQIASVAFVQDTLAGIIGSASKITSGTTKMTHDQGTKPRAMSTIVREQNTPDMTLKVNDFKITPIEKIISFAGGNSPAFINPGFGGDLAIPTNNPANGETVIITVNGTPCTITFVTSIGALPGNVLIGGSAAVTRANVAALINAPGTTNANQVAFTGAQLTAIQLLSATDDLAANIFIRAISSTVTSFSVVENMAGAGNTWTPNTTKGRIDLLVYDSVGLALAIRKGSEAVSPVAPTPTSLDVPLAQVFNRPGETVMKDVDDTTNGYIVSWYWPTVYRTDVVLQTDQGFKKYFTAPASEVLATANIIKLVNESGAGKVRKVVGLPTNTTAAIAIDWSNAQVTWLTADTVVISGDNGSAIYTYAGTITAGVLTLGSVVNVYAGGGVKSWRQKRVDASNFAIAYIISTGGSNSANIRAGTVAGTAITLGTNVAAITTAQTLASDYGIAFDQIAAGKFGLTFLHQVTAGNRQLKTVIVSVAANVVSNGTIVDLGAANIVGGGICGSPLNTDKYVVAFYENSSFNKVNAFVMTVAGTVISAGAQQTDLGIALATGATPFCLLALQSGTDTFILLAKHTTKTTLNIQTYSVSATTVTNGTLYQETLYLPNDDIINFGATILFGILIIASWTVHEILKFRIDGSATPLLERMSRVAFTFANSSGTGGLYGIDAYSADRVAIVARSTTTNRALLVVGNPDWDEFITAASQAYAVADNVPLKELMSGFTSLIPGMIYYMKEDGTGLNITPTYQRIGRAISATQIIKE